MAGKLKLTREVLAGIAEMRANRVTRKKIRYKYDLSETTLNRAYEIIDAEKVKIDKGDPLAITKKTLLKKSYKAVDTGLSDEVNKQQAALLGLKYMKEVGDIGNPMEGSVNINLNFNQMKANIPPEWEEAFIPKIERDRIEREMKNEQLIELQAEED